MPLLEVDLGQTSTYSNNGISGTQVNKFLGVVELNNINLQFSTPLHLTNRPNSIFNVKKIGTNEYILILTFEKI